MNLLSLLLKLALLSRAAHYDIVSYTTPTVGAVLQSAGGRLRLTVGHWDGDEHGWSWTSYPAAEGAEMIEEGTPCGCGFEGRMWVAWWG